VSQEGTGLSSENWVAQQLGGGPEESCRMPLLGKPGGGRSAKGRDRGIKENSPKGGARSIPDIKPPSCISWVPSSSDSEATSGLGATLQGGGGGAHPAGHDRPGDRPQAQGIRSSARWPWRLKTYLCKERPRRVEMGPSEKLQYKGGHLGQGQRK